MRGYLEVELTGTDEMEEMEERTTGETVAGTPPLHRPQQTEFTDILKVLVAVTVICGCFYLL